ncbi:19364_t:CDS:2, partial [Dentiscutata erythropus]
VVKAIASVFGKRKGSEVLSVSSSDSSSSNSEDEKEDKEINQLAEEIVKKVSQAVEAIVKKTNRLVEVEVVALAGLAAEVATQALSDEAITRYNLLDYKFDADFDTGDKDLCKDKK